MYGQERRSTGEKLWKINFYILEDLIEKDKSFPSPCRNIRATGQRAELLRKLLIQEALNSGLSSIFLNPEGRI